MRFVQGGQRDKTDQVAKHGFVDDGWLGITLATMNHSMSNRDDLPAGMGGHKPLQQCVEGLVVADLFADNGLVGNLLAGFVFGDQLGGIGADTVNLSGDFRIGRNRVGEREKGELDGR